MNIFIDSDVVISAVLSTSGASHQLLHQKKRHLSLFISNISQQELERVIKRFKVEQTILEGFIEKHLKVVVLENTNVVIKQQYKDYVKDVNDAHILGGAHKAKVRFLITYNIKDFRIEKIKKDFDISVLTPGIFLQYLRSIKS